MRQQLVLCHLSFEFAVQCPNQELGIITIADFDKSRVNPFPECQRGSDYLKTSFTAQRII